MPSPSRYYSSTAAKTTLANAISNVSSSLQLAAATNLPVQYPFTLILEKDTANEEIVEVTSLVGTAYQITRNIDNSGAKAHSVGALVEHGVSARDFTESRAHEVATTAHGVTGDVVGTGGSQTLTGKTLTSPIIDGTPVITGLSSIGMSSSSAAPKSYIDSIFGSATAASTSAASAATSASSALTSQTSAATSASSALTSQTSAATSASSALTSQSSAATSASSALTSQTSAATSASSAATSATSAANSATAAASSATTAAASVATISTSAALAATSANSAAASVILASEWATKTTGTVDGVEYSAKYYAQQANPAGNISAGSFTAKGVTLVGTGSGTFTQLTPASTNGYILSVDSATSSGLAWTLPNPGDITGVTAGTGLSGGGTSGSVTVSLDTSSVYVLPSQATHADKYLKTNGTTASWVAIPSTAGLQERVLLLELGIQLLD
jgi:hypothetical protein